MNRLLPASLIIACAAVGSASSPIGPGDHDLSWNTVDGGGQTSTGVSGYALTGTTGQPDASPAAASGTTYEMTGGFWPGIGIACLADCGTVDGNVNVTDLLALLAQWGGDGPCDQNGDDVVNVTDLLALLAAWGMCPE